MKKLVLLISFFALLPLSAFAQSTIMSFGTMYGVDGAFVKHNQIRGVRGDELPWAVGSATGSLTTDGHLVIHARGIVFANDPSVPPNIVGTNDDLDFGAPAAFARLSAGLDEAIVRIVTARPGLEPASHAMAALTPALIKAAGALPGCE